MGSTQHDSLEAGAEPLVQSGDDEVFDALSNATRRFVLAYLQRRDEPATSEALADAVAEFDDDVSVREARITLHHIHLPKLEAAGLVESDEAVALTDDAVDAVPLL